MQVGDLVKPKIHLEVYSVGKDRLEINTRWDDPQKQFQILDTRSGAMHECAVIVGLERTHRRDRRNRRGIAVMVPKIKLLIAGTVILVDKTRLERFFQSV
jgi:hypothetical protein